MAPPESFHPPPPPPRFWHPSCSLSVGIIFTSYALHVKYMPFLPPNNDMLGDKVALQSGMAMVYVRRLPPLPPADSMAVLRPASGAL